MYLFNPSRLKILVSPVQFWEGPPCELQGLGRPGQVLFIEEGKEEGVIREGCPEAAGEFQEGLNAPAASGTSPRGCDGGRGQTFAVAAGRGVNRTARKSHF